MCLDTMLVWSGNLCILLLIAFFKTKSVGMGDGYSMLEEKQSAQVQKAGSKLNVLCAWHKFNLYSNLLLSFGFDSGVRDVFIPLQSKNSG